MGYEKKQGKAQKIFRSTSKLKICHHDCADPKSLFFKKGLRFKIVYKDSHGNVKQNNYFKASYLHHSVTRLHLEFGQNPDIIGEFQ